VVLGGLAFVVGCIPGLVEINRLPTSTPPVVRTTIAQGPRARLQRENDNLLWLEIDRARDSGVVGGYIGDLTSHRGALVIALNGAGGPYPEGTLQADRTFHYGYAGEFRAAGLLTWTVALPECGTPYGGDDLADLLEVIDWLDEGGREYLDVREVFVVGYSTGATVVNLLNPLRDVTAIVSLGGLADGQQLQAHYGFYQTLVGVFALNTAFCQLGDTLRAYGPPGSTGWEALDAVSRVSEFRNPTLYIHGTADVIYAVENTRRIEARYRALLAAGRNDLPELLFEYPAGGQHFGTATETVHRQRVLAYVLGFLDG
jgi:dienelactone hydrolase